MTDHQPDQPDHPDRSEQRRYPHGVPSWVDVTQPDLEAATRFYGELFGWAFTEVVPTGAPGSYLVATLDGHDVAALAPTDRSGRVAWRTYVAVNDADATAAAVTAAGGTVLAAPEDAGPGGRSATCADPQGAEFRLWQARNRLGAQLANTPGAWNFSILHTAAPDAVWPFYGQVFGWSVDPALGAGMIRVPGYGDHLAATVDPGIYDRQAFAPPGFADVVAGFVKDADSSAAGWQVTFTVADRDGSVTTAERLGATVLSTSEDDWTRTAAVRDPQGAVLTLSQFAPRR
jgi:predicted enzyme related to lactoylglutathione lyase